VLTSFDVVVQGRHAFKFNQAWISAELLLTGLWPPREARPPRWGKEGVAPVELCTWSMMATTPASLCKWMPLSGLSSWYFCFRLRRLRCPSRREISSGTSSSSFFSSSGHRELKVGREYAFNMFNGFTNAWFDYWFWQVSISYDYADISEWSKKFLVFCITIFPEKHKIK